ncbi:hypothetical protein CAPTEDRAFT_180944 [Capitella teleta]|uniref:ATP synthase subunit s-like protein n=1 Tax=Capitella teleta TaxID=283909 RepID=R7UW93_CAPTE|nr:hypothetical protein CAPTEDRAFT_180944 [Capitella teleta]|eukprot:ELU07631.1 hypothetical protein CAPTEDRAFT_180944 [Capitella teleta]
MASALRRLAPPTRLLLFTNLPASTYQGCRHLYDHKWEFNRDFLDKLHRPYDISLAGLNKYLKKKQKETLIKDQSFVPERLEVLGRDLSAAHFIVKRGGAVKFVGQDKWIKLVDGAVPLPSTFNKHMKLEGVDASGTNFMRQSLENFIGLTDFKFLRLSNCKYVDDWCLDSFIRFKDTLEVLDLSGCPNVTERGLACLHKLPKLRRLTIADMPLVQNPPLVAILLEEAMPNCFIEGIDYTDTEKYATLSYRQPAKFVEDSQNYVREELGVEVDTLEEDYKLLVAGQAAAVESEEPAAEPAKLAAGENAEPVESAVVK